MKFSIIIPVYNRPEEIDELLHSLTQQDYNDFEVIVVEDGSSIKCEEVVKKYDEQLNLHYYFKENTGPGFSRNYGYEKASGDYFIVLDSDCLIPPGYLQEVNNFLNRTWLDAFGGPDRAHESFTHVQKAINYAMTSLFTTGGTRGNKRHVGAYHPRSFNMGISKEVYNKTGGYIITKMGEDIELSIRIIKAGFKTGFIENAFVYHKRRTSFPAFFRQLHFFGRGRINISRFFPEEFRPIHLLPTFFTLALLALCLSPLLNMTVFYIGLSLFSLYLLLILTDAIIKTKNIPVSIQAVFASLLLLIAYGSGLTREWFKKLFEKKAPNR